MVKHLIYPIIKCSLDQVPVVPLSVRMFPDSSSSVTAVIHTAFGLGLLCGPLLGSVLLPISNYETPFILTGLAEGITCILSIFLVPTNVKQTNFVKPKVSNSEFLKFFFQPRVLLFIIPEMFLFSTMGFRDSSFADYLKTNLNVSKNNVGYAFLPFSMAYVVAAPIFGILVKRGLGVFVLIFGQVVIVMAFFAFYIPSFEDSVENVLYVLPMLFVFGVSVSSIFNPHYLVLEQIALKRGYDNPGQIKTLGASCYNLMAATSRSVGAFVFGGYLNEAFQFYNTCLIYTCVLVVSAVWQIVYLVKEGYIRRVFYHAAGIQVSELSSIININ